MNNFKRLRNAAITLILTAGMNSACAQQADFNEVGKRMAIMLQNSHFARFPYNAELGKKFFDEYLNLLDPQKLYFTQKDVDDLSLKYGADLHSAILQGSSIEPSKEIYHIYRSRAVARIQEAQKLLEGEFDFSSNEKVMLSRKDANWPKDENAAREIWAKQIKEAVLSETLRQETVSRLAKEQDKPNPNAEALNPAKKISLRYQRLLSSIEGEDDQDIANHFLSAIARSYDPHTDYMSFREMNRFKGDMKNELIGIGALLQPEEDGATIIKGIVVGGPADKQGSLKLNDRVVAVDTNNSNTAEGMTDIMFMPIDKVVELIRGKEGSSVALKVEPAGGPSGETNVIVIKREKVEMKDEQAKGEMIETKGEDNVSKKIGVITLPSFYADFDEGTTRCSDDVEKILIQLIEEGMDGLIFDLRNNGGGSLEEVRRMTGFFVPKGPVVQVKSTTGQVQVKDSDGAKPIYEGPMAVLVDKSSASASEILAGALQDYQRAIIIGNSSTFGKGTVQQPMDIGRYLPLFSARDQAGFLKVTIQKFYRPSGSSTQNEGVVSDIKLPSIMDALDVGEAFMEHSLPHDRIRPATNFKASESDHLFINKLREQSIERIEKCEDFGYVIQDVMKAKKRLKENVVSLNKTERDAELLEAEKERKQRNLERLERFKKMADKDLKQFTFYRLSLDDIEKGQGLQKFDPNEENADYMRRAVDDTANLDETPKWPAGLNPEKREAIYIMNDLMKFTEAAKLAGIPQNSEKKAE